MKKSTIFKTVICISIIVFTVNVFAGPIRNKEQKRKIISIKIEKPIFARNVQELSIYLLIYFFNDKEVLPKTSTLPPAISCEAPQEPPGDNVPPVSTLPPPTGG